MALVVPLPGPVRRVVRGHGRAREEVCIQGAAILRSSRSKWRVDTGLSRASFRVRGRGSKAVIFNPVSYAPFVEARYGEARATLRANQKRLADTGRLAKVGVVTTGEKRRKALAPSFLENNRQLAARPANLARLRQFEAVRRPVKPVESLAVQRRQVIGAVRRMIRNGRQDDARKVVAVYRRAFRGHALPRDILQALDLRR